MNTRCLSCREHVLHRGLNTTQHNTTQHNTTQHNTTQHNTTQHNTTQHNTTQQQNKIKNKNTAQNDTRKKPKTKQGMTQHNTTQRNTITKNVFMHGFSLGKPCTCGQKTVHVHGFPRENPCMNTFFLKPGSWRETFFTEKNRVQGTWPPCPFLLLGWAFGQCVCLSLSLSLSLSVCVCLSLFLSRFVSLFSLSSFLSPLSPL